ncbi:two-component system, regulatory protein [Streptomyces sp. SPB074]|nr:two-component system, regulatory protein [Streptomyces sp. SPB074]
MRISWGAGDHLHGLRPPHRPAVCRTAARHTCGSPSSPFPTSPGPGRNRSPPPLRLEGWPVVTIRVLLADDQDMVRRGMRRILEQQPGVEVVGEAADGLAALEAAGKLRPDVLLLDIRMPRLDGLEVTRRLLAPGAAFKPRVVIVTTFGLDEYVYPALRYGASGFLLKRSGPRLLVEAVMAAVAGDSLISPSITVRLLRHVTEASPRTPAPVRPASANAPAPLDH